MADTRDVFVSHIHEDETHIETMKNLLDERGFQVRDSSITSETPNKAKNPDYIKHYILAPQVDWASVVVVLISPGMRHSEYVDFEIEYAHRHDKRIVGVWTHGAADSDVPEALEKYADAVVAWRGDAIKDAICGEKSNWETKDGTPRQRLAITRHGC
jgi:hypothetical protein